MIMHDLSSTSWSCSRVCTVRCRVTEYLPSLPGFRFLENGTAGQISIHVSCEYNRMRDVLVALSLKATLETMPDVHADFVSVVAVISRDQYSLPSWTIFKLLLRRKPLAEQVDARRIVICWLQHSSLRSDGLYRTSRS